MSVSWEKIYQHYRGQWVALAQDEETVLASGKTAKEALTKAVSSGYKNPVIAFMPKELLTYVGAQSWS